MNLPETYEYLMRARVDLRATLEQTTDEILSRDLLGGPRFRCIKDLVFHIADVEDGWINGDILRGQMIQKDFPTLFEAREGFAQFPLRTLLDYWSQVEQGTLLSLPALIAAGLDRVVPVEDWPDKKLTVDGLLWHVMIHEMRHTAQIAVLLRTQGIQPPSLDLLFYLPIS